MFLFRSHDIRKNSLPKVSQNLFYNKQNTKADNRFNKNTHKRHKKTLWTCMNQLNIWKMDTKSKQSTCHRVQLLEGQRMLKWVVRSAAIAWRQHHRLLCKRREIRCQCNWEQSVLIFVLEGSRSIQGQCKCIWMTITVKCSDADCSRYLEMYVKVPA